MNVIFMPNKTVFEFLEGRTTILFTVQGRRSHLKSEGAQGGYFFLCNFLLLFWAIWENDLFSKS